MHGVLPAPGCTFTSLSKKVWYEPAANSTQLFQKGSSTTTQRFQYPAEISYSDSKSMKIHHAAYLSIYYLWFQMYFIVFQIISMYTY